ncbi:mCG1028277, partial [Mus musculus]
DIPARRINPLSRPLDRRSAHRWLTRRHREGEQKLIRLPPPPQLFYFVLSVHLITLCLLSFSFFFLSPSPFPTYFLVAL